MAAISTTTTTTTATAATAEDLFAGGDGSDGFMSNGTVGCVPIVETAHQYCQTDLEDENLTLIQWRQKYEPDKYPLFDGTEIAATDSISLMNNVSMPQDVSVAIAAPLLVPVVAEGE